jgi:hypothetical protein
MHIAASQPTQSELCVGTEKAAARAQHVRNRIRMRAAPRPAHCLSSRNHELFFSRNRSISICAGWRMCAALLSCHYAAEKARRIALFSSRCSTASRLESFFQRFVTRHLSPPARLPLIPERHRWGTALFK